MEVPVPKPEGLQALRVFGSGTSQETPFTMIPPRLFHTFSFFRHPGLVKRDFFQPEGVSWSMFVAEGTNIGRVKSQYTSLGCRKNAHAFSVVSLQERFHYSKLVFFILKKVRQTKKLLCDRPSQQSHL